jgi:allantoinase
MRPARYGPFPYSPIVDRKPLRWSNGAYLAVWVIPNIEFFPLNATITNEAQIIPNIPAWSQRDYGNRVAVFRMMDVMAARAIRGTVALNADVCDEHPRVVERALELGWELMGHCETNCLPLTRVPADEEAGVIARTLDRIEAAAGSRPQGWLGSGLNETWDSLDYLADSGVRYIADWVNDDQPYLMDLGGRTMVSIPYSLEINDARAIGRHYRSSDEFSAMIRRQFDVLYDEGQVTAKVMAIALHPYLTGVPHCIGMLADSLDYIAEHDKVWFATGSEIVADFLAQTSESDS